MKLPPYCRQAFFVGVILIGVLLRVESVRWNYFTQGDVQMDSGAAASFVRDGSLLMFTGDICMTPAALRSLPPASAGVPLALHAPVWPLLGAAVTFLWSGQSTRFDTFLSLRILSFLSGLGVLVLAWLIARRLGSRGMAPGVVSVLSLSYLMIDFSGNGSFYSFETALYLLWVLIALTPSVRWRPVLFGAIGGIAYLVNFQCMILIPAAIVVLFFDEGTSWFRFVRDAILVVAVTGFVASPWLIRNAFAYDNPFFSHYLQQTYIYIKAGVQPVKVNGLMVYKVGLHDWIAILWGMLTVWLPNNFYYAARKLTVLAPLTFFLFSFSLIEAATSLRWFRKVSPLLAVLFFHILLSSVWPVMKFRHIVPILPLVVILGCAYLYALQIKPFLRQTAVATMVLSTGIITLIAYKQIPTHTFYYDGAITQDAYHGSQELETLRACGLLPPL